MSRLPFYLEPQADEALLSWVLRLSARLGVSRHALVSEAFGIEDRADRTQWWRRPRPLTLERISEVTGIDIERLRAMTSHTWSVYRDDEANERFGADRYRRSPRTYHAFRHVVCEQCLAGNATPYLRQLWVIGWLAICPLHSTIMIDRCQRCASKLHIHSAASVASFAPRMCAQCGEHLRAFNEAADPSVLRLQEALVEGKMHGTCELPGIGRLTWPELVVFADVLLGKFWLYMSLAQLHRVRAIFEQRFAVRSPIPKQRYVDLAFFTWLTESWPNGPGSQVAMDMLARWLSVSPVAVPGDSEKTNVYSHIRQRLWTVLEGHRSETFGE